MIPVWVDEQVVLAIHDEQLAEHGGPPGVNMGLLQSALARAQNLFAHEEADIFRLCAAYAFRLAKGHAFVDGNKRTSLVATELFLALNGYELRASDGECLDVWLAIAGGALSEGDFVLWVKRQVVPAPTHELRESSRTE